MSRLTPLLSAALLLLPLTAQASDTQGMGEAAALMFVYLGLAALHLLGCAIAVFKSRSWRPLLVLPMSIGVTAVFTFALVSIDPKLPSGFAAFILLAIAPLLAILLSILLYRLLEQERKSANGGPPNEQT